MIVSIFLLVFLAKINSLCATDDLKYIKQDTCSWHSWSGITCSPARIFYPTNKEDVCAIIKEALPSRMPIRFYGSGHSVNDLVCTEGYLINTDNFNQILELDTKNCRVRVQGGIKLKHLYKQLAKNNMALANQGFIKEQSIAGALATGTHGTGKTGTLSDFIVSIELIDGLGNYHIIDHKNEEWLQAARINLGALGFVYAVTLQCVPLFVLEHERVMKDWSNVLANFSSYYTNNDYMMLLGHPICQNVLIYTWNVTDQKPTNNFLIKLADRLLMNEVTNYLTIKMAHIAPGLTNDFVTQFLNAMERKPHREYSYKSLSPIKNPHEVNDYIEEEIAIPIRHFVEAINDIKQLYERYCTQDFQLVGFMTCRFVNGSRKALLSPAYGQDCAYISLITISCFKAYKEFYREFEAIMRKYTYARPHWGKFNQITTSDVAHAWGNNLDRFNAVRDQLDPYKLFTNQYLYKRLD